MVARMAPSSRFGTIIVLGAVAIAIIVGWMVAIQFLLGPMDPSEETTVSLFLRYSNVGSLVGGTILILGLGWILYRAHEKPPWMFATLVLLHAGEVAIVLVNAYALVSIFSGPSAINLNILPFTYTFLAFASATSLFVLLLLALPGPGVVPRPEAAEPHVAAEAPPDPRFP